MDILNSLGNASNLSLLNNSSSLDIVATIALSVLAFVIILLLVPMCLIFKKAGRAWWEAIIPLYNMYVLTVITGTPWWILFGIFFPFLNWIVMIYLYYHLSRRFGYDIPFTIGLVVFPFIFLPILGFGGALYTPLAEVEAVETE